MERRDDVAPDRVGAALRVLHPLPSALNAALVAALAVVAGASTSGAGLLAVAMFGFQASIGALNDVVDAERDRVAKPVKPIAAGIVSERVGIAIALAGGAIGLGISAAFGLPVLVLGAAGWGCGLAYDLVLRERGLGWLSFAAAFPLLLAWTWLAAAGALPPGWPVLLPMSAVAGVAIHLANSLVDLAADDRAGVPSLATALGEVRAPIVLAVLTVCTYGAAWAVLASLPERPMPALTAASAGSIAAVLGVALSWRPDARAREWGWLLQAAGLALLAVGWVAAVA